MRWRWQGSAVDVNDLICATPKIAWASCIVVSAAENYAEIPSYE